MSFIRLEPTASEVFGCMKTAIKMLPPEDRALIRLPRDFSHYESGGYNWDNLEEVQMNARGSNVPNNVFVTLRFNQDDEDNRFVDVFVDIYRV